MFKDDGSGRLVTTIDYSYSGSELSLLPSGSVVGEVVYPHGMALISNQTAINIIQESGSFDIEWKSNQPIITSNFYCKVKDFEFNYSLNPSSIDVDGNLKNNLTGSEFVPYITSVGLYNDTNELLAVAKLSRPVKKSISTDMTFILKIDM